MSPRQETATARLEGHQPTASAGKQSSISTRDGWMATVEVARGQEAAVSAPTEPRSRTLKESQIDVGSVQDEQRKEMDKEKLTENSSSSDKNWGVMKTNPDYNPDEEILPIEMPDLDIESLSRDLVEHLGKAFFFINDQQAEAFAYKIVERWLDKRVPQINSLRKIRDYTAALKYGGLPGNDGNVPSKRVFNPEKETAKDFVHQEYKRELDAGILDTTLLKKSGNQGLARHIENKITSGKGRTEWSDFDVMNHNELLCNLQSSFIKSFSSSVNIEDLNSMFRSILRASLKRDEPAEQGMSV